VHPDAQRILENLEDNREWFASQLQPDSPSAMMPTNQSNNANVDRNVFEQTMEQQLDSQNEEGHGDGVSTADGREVQVIHEFDSVSAEGGDHESRRRSSGNNRCQQGTNKPTHGHPELTAPRKSRETSPSINVIGQMVAPAVGDGNMRTSTKESPDGDIKDEQQLQLQADKIQFQITLDEPEPEMQARTNLNKHDTICGNKGN